MNLANKITITRIFLVPVFISCVLYGQLTLALLVFLIAAASDAVDGFIARHFQQKTSIGAMLDPIADKLLVLSGFLCFVIVKDLHGAVALPPYVPVIVIFRDAIILLGALLIILLKGGIEIQPTFLGKITTFLQMFTLLALLVRASYAPVLWNIMVAGTIISGIEYVLMGSRMLNGTIQTGKGQGGCQ